MWADAAKGCCILLVVLHHLVTKHYDLLLPADLGALSSAWSAFTGAAKPVRMPLFFVLSGLFAAGAVRRPWSRVVVARVVTPYYLYATWLSIHAVLFMLVFDRALPMNRTRSIEEWLTDLTFPSTGVWYLYALAAYFIVAKCLLGLDRRLVVVAAATLAVAAVVMPIESINRQSALQHLVYFLAGAYFPELVRRVAGAPVHRSMPAWTGACVVLGTALWAGGVSGPLGDLATSVVAVPLAITVTVAACRRRTLASVAAFVGRRTLPIYVLHVPLLAVLHAATVASAPEATSTAWTVTMALYPLLATVAVAAACLLLHEVLLRAGGGALFRLPVVGTPATRGGGRDRRSLAQAASAMPVPMRAAPIPAPTTPPRKPPTLAPDAAPDRAPRVPPMHAAPASSTARSSPVR